MCWNRAVLLLVLAGLSGAPALAEPLKETWQADTVLLDDTEQAIRSGGILAVGPRAARLQQALQNAQLTYRDGDTAYILVDGNGETLVATVMAQKQGGAKSISAMPNPYPLIALFLGSYDDETGKFDDAVRVLDLGLTLFAVQGVALGDTRPLLLIERGEALNQLKRWDDALADFDDGLKIDDVTPTRRAHMLRGLGYTYTELGRLDEAEADYKQSLTLDPGNAGAQNELAYIAQLRAGHAPVQGSLAPVQPQGTPQQSH